MRSTLISLAAAALLLAGCGGDDEKTQPAAPPPKPTPKQPAPSEKAVGMGDQNAAFFDAPLFRALKIDKARRVVPWDAMKDAQERAGIDQWLAGAKKAAVEPFVTFGASRRDPTKLPSADEFRDAFQAFRRRYPQVRAYAAWNEVNHKSQPTADHPDRAAAYYTVVRDGCEGCTVVAADVLDQVGFTGYLKRFTRAVSGPKPQLW